MSALDDAIDNAEGEGWGCQHADAARAELALLRRCRDAVLRLGGRSDPATGLPWWLAIDDDGFCVGCGSRVLAHADGCPAVEIDKLAKEVRGE